MIDKKRGVEIACLGFALLLGSLGPSARAQVITVDFNDLPSTGGAHSHYTQNGFSLDEIFSGPDPLHHFHAVPGTDGTTAAQFFSDDGSPFNYSYGGAHFHLISIDVNAVAGGTFQLTSSSGATQLLDHTGTIMFGAGFSDISSFRHDWISTTDGNMIIDNIRFEPAAVPGPGALAIFASGLSAGTALLRKRRCQRGVF